MRRELFVTSRSPEDRRRDVSRDHRAIAALCTGAMIGCLGFVVWATAVRAELADSLLAPAARPSPFAGPLATARARGMAEQTPVASAGQPARQRARRVLDGTHAKEPEWRG